MPTLLYSEDFTGDSGDNGWRSTGAPAGPWVEDPFVGGSQVAASGGQLLAGPRPNALNLTYDQYKIWQQENRLLNRDDGYVALHYKITLVSAQYTRDWICGNDPGTCAGKFGMAFDSRQEVLMDDAGNIYFDSSVGFGGTGGGGKQPGSAGNAPEGNSQNISFDGFPRSQTPGLQQNQMVLATYLYDHTARLNGNTYGEQHRLSTSSTPNGVLTEGQTIDVWMFRLHNTPGQQDGRLIYCIDGELAYDGLRRFTDHPDFDLQSFRFYSYIGGGDPSPSTSELQFAYDDVEIYSDFTLAEIQALHNGNQTIVVPNQVIDAQYTGNGCYL